MRWPLMAVHRLCWLACARSPCPRIAPRSRPSRAPSSAYDAPGSPVTLVMPACQGAPTHAVGARSSPRGNDPLRAPIPTHRGVAPSPKPAEPTPSSHSLSRAPGFGWPRSARGGPLAMAKIASTPPTRTSRAYHNACAPSSPHRATRSGCSIPTSPHNLMTLP